MPGGVNCPVPAFKSVTGQPIVINSVKGFHMLDNEVLFFLPVFYS